MFLARIQILSSRRVHCITWNIQAPDTALAILRFLYQCYVYSFNAHCSSKNSRSSNAMLQLSLNERNGTHYDLFGLLLLFHLIFFPSYFLPSGLTPRREKITCPTVLKCLHFNSSSTAIEAVSMLSTRRTPFVSSLRSYSLQCPVSRPRFNHRSRCR